MWNNHKPIRLIRRARPRVIQEDPFPVALGGGGIALKRISTVRRKDSISPPGLITPFSKFGIRR